MGQQCRRRTLLESGSFDTEGPPKIAHAPPSSDRSLRPVALNDDLPRDIEPGCKRFSLALRELRITGYIEVTVDHLQTRQESATWRTEPTHGGLGYCSDDTQTAWS